MSGLFAAPLFGHLGHAAADTLIARFHSTLERLNLEPGVRAEFDRVLAVHGLPLSARPMRVNLDAARIECRRRLREYPIAALLSTAPAAGHLTDHDRLIGWTVLVSLWLLARDPDHITKVGSACAAVRLMANPLEASAVAEFKSKTASAQVIFAAARAAEHRGQNYPHAIRFAPIRVLFEAYLERKAAITREGEAHQAEDVQYDTQTSPIASIDLPDEVDADAVIHVTTAFLKSGGNDFNAEHDIHRIEADVPATGTAIEKGVRKLQALRRTRLLQDSIKRRMALPSHYGSFTEHEVSKILAARASLDPGSKQPRWREHVVILGCLLTGLSPKVLLTLPRIKGRGQPRRVEQWFEIADDEVLIVRDPMLAKLAIPEFAHRLVGDAPGPLRLALPTEVARGLVRLWSDPIRTDPTLTEIDQAFSELTQDLGRRQTIRRMTSVLRDRLVRRGVDPVVSAYISGDTRQNVPALYYATIENAAIERAYREVVMALPGAKFTWPNPRGSLVGSSLNIDQNMIKRFYKAAQSEISSLSRSSWQDLVMFHNRYTTMVIVSLTLLSGHRPVRNPFERLSDIDLDRRWLYISDKELRKVASGRFIPVPQLFVDQLGAWLQHLRSLAIRMRPLRNQDVVHACTQALCGKGDLLFFISDDTSAHSLSTIPVTPKKLAKQLMSNIWPLPLNWGRHLQRRLLMGSSAELIDAFMGHADPGAEAFASHSGLSASDMEELRKSLDDIARLIGVEIFIGLQ